MDASSVATHARRRLMEAVLLAGALAALAAIGCHRAEPNVVLLGDSVTAGYGASDAAHSWTSLLGVPVSGEAAPGEPSGFFLGQTWTADTVVVELGINDCSQGVPPATYGDHMREILANIMAPHVVLVIPYRTAASRPPFGTRTPTSCWASRGRTGAWRSWICDPCSAARRRRCWHLTSCTQTIAATP